MDDFYNDHCYLDLNTLDKESYDIERLKDHCEKYLKSKVHSEHFSNHGSNHDSDQGKDKGTDQDTNNGTDQDKSPDTSPDTSQSSDQNTEKEILDHKVDDNIKTDIVDTNSNNSDISGDNKVQNNSNLNSPSSQNNSRGYSYSPFNQYGMNGDIVDNNVKEPNNEQDGKFPVVPVMIVVIVIATIAFFVIKKKRNEKAIRDKFENVPYNGKTNLFSNARALLLNDEYVNGYENLDQSFDSPTIAPEPPAPAYKIIEMQPIDPTLNNPYHKQNSTEYNNVPQPTVDTNFVNPNSLNNTFSPASANSSQY